MRASCPWTGGDRRSEQHARDGERAEPREEHEDGENIEALAKFQGEPDEFHEISRMSCRGLASFRAACPLDNEPIEPRLRREAWAIARRDADIAFVKSLFE